MKGVICYYSGSGNTKLACRYITKRIEDVEFDLFDVAKGGIPDFEQYEIAAFATFTDFFGPPYLFQTFVGSLPQQNGKPAFVLGTYGNRSGGMLKALGRAVTARGFHVIAGHSLHTPESYPPMVADGKGNEQAPDEQELSDFNDFVAELDQLLKELGKGKAVKGKKIDGSFLLSLISPPLRTMSRRLMGEKYVDESLCIECGTCKKRCPYGAIELDPKPVFDMGRCYGCWACFNHCRQKAIYTQKYRGTGHYPKPIDQLREKLKV